MKLGVDVLEGFSERQHVSQPPLPNRCGGSFLSGIDAGSPLRPVNRCILLMSGTKAAADHLSDKRMDRWLPQVAKLGIVAVR
jgi:hypothetical protein